MRRGPVVAPPDVERKAVIQTGAVAGTRHDRKNTTRAYCAEIASSELRCPLFPRKQTLIRASRMSAQGHKEAIGNKQLGGMRRQK